MDQQKIYRMPFARVYPLYIQKAVRKGRSKEEVDRIISWLTGYTEEYNEPWKLDQKNVTIRW